MPIFAIGDKVPRIHPSAFIAPTASIVGDVTIHENASVWYGAVVRGDTSFAVIHRGEIMGVVRPEEVTVEELGLMMAGSKKEESVASG